MTEAPSTLRPSSLSIIIPLRDEADNLRPLLAELDAFRASHPWPLEVIVVDDGSRDGSWGVIRDEAASRPWLKAIRFRANRGQTAAMTAGIENSSGQLVAFLDADLQNDPNDIPRLIAPIESDQADVVCGWRRRRRDHAGRTLPSIIANWLIRKALRLPIHDVGCTLKVFRREYLEAVNLLGEMHRFLAAYAQSQGARVIEIEVNHRPRERGRSKYGFSRVGKVLIDLLTVVMLSSYGSSPAYLFGKIAALLFAFGTVAFGIVAWRVLVLERYETTPMVFVWLLSYISALIALMSGLLAEINIRVLYQVGVRKSYEIRESIGFGS
ncbi:MAG TPA: glycosyltransferase family 2 protein [Thermoanaerobaculia bacterium]|nr:glycosyltransferase family 2 protein [Thermoanaerobaculia bacterium]